MNKTSKASQHTKGPWKIDTSFGELEIASDLYGIAKLNPNLGLEKANAALIAAAPDLLEAAQQLLYRIEVLETEDDVTDPVGFLKHELERLSKAIAKAEGRDE